MQEEGTPKEEYEFGYFHIGMRYKRKKTGTEKEELRNE
jgi:hypothetical protein